MLSFEWPWLAWALLLPFLARRLPPYRRTLSSALHVPNLDMFSLKSATSPIYASKRWLWLLALSAYTCLVIATMRPVWVGDHVDIPLKGRDLMLAIDLSLSMRENDMTWRGQHLTRIRATKKVATEFVNQREGDRIGLIVFGAYPYLQTPLTFDRKTIEANIVKSALGDADDIQRKIHGTSIGDAIGLAVKRLRESDVKDKTLILLTDGSDTSSQLPPIKAAELAAKDHLKIYTIGIGSDQRETSLLGFQFNLGNRAELDEKTLQDIAEITGGRYFRARDTQELQKIYNIIDQLEPNTSDSQHFKPSKSLFFYPLAVALLISVITVLTYSWSRN